MTPKTLKNDSVIITSRIHIGAKQHSIYTVINREKRMCHRFANKQELCQHLEYDWNLTPCTGQTPEIRFNNIMRKIGRDNQ